MKNTRTRHTAAFKAKVALAALREDESIAQLTKRFDVHASQVHKWKRQFIENAPLVFDSGASTPSDNTDREDELLKKIGELTIERDFCHAGSDVIADEPSSHGRLQSQAVHATAV